jgi:hypothetical protein
LVLVELPGAAKPHATAFRALPAVVCAGFNQLPPNSELIMRPKEAKFQKAPPTLCPLLRRIDRRLLHREGLEGAALLAVANFRQMQGKILARSLGGQKLLFGYVF